MMGQLSSGQERLFYSFNLEDHIPANHLLHNIDWCLDLSDLRPFATGENRPKADCRKRLENPGRFILVISTASSTLLFMTTLF